MRLFKAIALCACLVALFAAGCAGRRPLDIDAPVVTSKTDPTEEEIYKAIVRAAAVSNWMVSRAGPGQLIGERTQGPHRATVRIGYSAQRYRIDLSETSMIDRPAAPAGGGGITGAASLPGGAAPSPASTTVHRHYNRWVHELDKAIRGQLMTIGL